ncbi:uncharacterized protein [Dermacentor albipictus]|uniref:uncharacterized protein n=1 Tax=Dermacentor albipictus TaxID=60249 RepID=UPI0038FD1D0A
MGSASCFGTPEDHAILISGFLVFHLIPVHVRGDAPHSCMETSFERGSQRKLPVVRSYPHLRSSTTRLGWQEVHERVTWPSFKGHRDTSIPLETIWMMCRKAHKIDKRRTSTTVLLPEFYTTS